MSPDPVDTVSLATASDGELPTLYCEFADWWPLLSSPADYAEEASLFVQTLRSACSIAPKTLLELGSGGGNNAAHLKRHFKLTLVDLSSGMLEVSRRLNPECEHVQGDMRTVRLGREFEAVFVHDAIAYMRTEVDLLQAMETAFLHCRPGGAALFCPDQTRETFRPSTSHGGHDSRERGLRYLEWTWEPDPPDGTYVVDMVYLLREGSAIRSVLDRHVCGLMRHDDWMRLISNAGFEARSLPFEHSVLEPGSARVYLGIKPLRG